MPTTLKNIAEAAGVSIGTVDRALKNRGRINPEVAEKIKQIAKDMNYQPNKIAAGLVKKSRKYKFTVILHIRGNDFFDEIIKGIKLADKEIRDYGMSVTIYTCEDFDDKMQLSNIEKAISNGADGIIIVPINSPIIRKKIKELQKESYPIVFLTSYLNRFSPFTQIHCDYYRSGKLGAKLIDLISDNNSNVMAFFPSSIMLGNNERKEGFESYFFNNQCKLNFIKSVELSNNHDISYSVMLDMLTANDNVNSILFCGDATIALKVLDTINRPIKAVFFDFAFETKQALKNDTIHAVITQNPRNQGYTAVNVLFQYFSLGVIPKKEILIDSQILFKESIE